MSDPAPPPQQDALPSSDQERMEVVFDQFLGSIVVPKNIDPVLLNLWAEREYRERGKTVEEKIVPKRSPPLILLFAAYVGILAMILTIFLGFWNSQAAPFILDAAVRNLLIFAFIGAFAGWIADYAVQESVETVIREVVARSPAPEETEN